MQAENEVEAINIICSAFRSQFENNGPESRNQGERILDQFVKEDYFVRASVSIVCQPQIQIEVRKAAAILLDKKLLSLTSIKDLEEKEAFAYCEAIIEGLCSEDTNTDLKSPLKSALQSVCYTNLGNSN